MIKIIHCKSIEEDGEASKAWGHAKKNTSPPSSPGMRPSFGRIGFPVAAARARVVTKSSMAEPENASSRRDERSAEVKGECEDELRISASGTLSFCKEALMTILDFSLWPMQKEGLSGLPRSFEQKFPPKQQSRMRSRP